MHKALGPGLLEKVYSPRGIGFPLGIPQDKVCFCHELSKRGLKYKRQVNVPIICNGLVFDEGLRLDVLVEDLVICELSAGSCGKAVAEMNPVWEASRNTAGLSHLRLTGERLVRQLADLMYH